MCRPDADRQLYDWQRVGRSDGGEWTGDIGKADRDSRRVASRIDDGSRGYAFFLLEGTSVLTILVREGKCFL